MAIVLGAIADDFTGATDLANNLVRAGMRCVQMIGVPEGPRIPDDVDAVVVALKSRAVPAQQAVADSLEALDWLQAQGARQIFFKYCSTFDSTEAGNIGPVSDALLERLGAAQTVMVPAFPVNGRTVYQGHLFVGDRLLSESGMEHHPLNPMTEADLVRFLGRQTPHPVGLAARP
ncbi:MAG TPA: four-carbon acid sugar kinase family protein, partial [Guyparkeria sp.]|nr:four-carbon acid sugar kinase family protein [Guyparkeria sp.]